MARSVHRRFLLLCAAFWMSGCSRNPPLTVAVHPWIGYESLCLAQAAGWLPPGVTLRHGSRAADSLAALEAGEVDAATLTLDEVLLARDAGVPLGVIAVLDSSAGADVLLARPGLARLADLAGKRVGYEPTAVGALVLNEVLARSGLPGSAIQRVELPVTQQLAAWRRGDIDAVISYEPTAALLQAEGAVRLFDSRQMPDMIFDVLAVRRDRLAGRTATLRLLVAAHFRSLDYLRGNREDAVYRIAAHQGVTAADVHRALGSVILPDQAGNRYALQAGSRFDAAARRLHDLMAQRRLLARPDDLGGLFEAGYLPLANADDS